MKPSSLLKLTAFAALGLVGSATQASFEVQVGYADDLRPSPFFPGPWAGGLNVDTFAGGSSGNYDAGAVRVINTGASPITFGGLTVDGFGDGASFTLWNSYIGNTIQPGHSMIFTQTASYNFDSSDDQGSNPAALPQVHLTIDGGSQTFVDTAQVLNTEGTDFLAQNNLNESHQWRDIGTFGGQSGNVPDSGSTLAFIGLSVAGLAAFRARKP